MFFKTRNIASRVHINITELCRIFFTLFLETNIDVQVNYTKTSLHSANEHMRSHLCNQCTLAPRTHNHSHVRHPNSFLSLPLPTPQTSYKQLEHNTNCAHSCVSHIPAKPVHKLYKRNFYFGTGVYNKNYNVQYLYSL